MIAAGILVLSFLALVQWVVSYCRSFVIASEEVRISEKTRELVGPSHDLLDPREFDLILGLARKAPNPADDEMQILIVSAYFRILQAGDGIIRRISPKLEERLDDELARCVHFAAVALDRRLASLGA